MHIRKTAYIISSILIILVLVIIGTDWNTDDNQIKPQNTLTVGFASPLSGDAATWGTGVLNGAMIALDKINNEGGINGKRLKFMVEDSKCDGKQATIVAQKLISSLEIPLIIGPLCSSEVLAMAPITEANDTVLLSSGASAPAVKYAGDNVFSIYPLDNYEATMVSTFAYNKLNKKSAGIIFANNDYGKGGRDVLYEVFTKLGGNIVFEHGYSLGETDFRTPLSKLSDSGADVLFVWGQPTEMVALLRQKKELNNQIQIITSTNLIEDNEVLIKTDTQLANNVIYSKFKTIDNANIRYLNEKYQQRYNKESDMFAGLGYDVVMLAAEALKKNTDSAGEIRKRLLEIKNFPGASGEMSFNENGTVVKDFMFKTIKDGEFVEID